MEKAGVGGHGEKAERKKVDPAALRQKKAEGEKITMLTAYDCPTARLLDEAGIDVVLVGDSVGNVLLGYKDTLPVTMDEMIHHTRAVTRGASLALVIGDMPFMSYNTGARDAILNAGRFVKEGGAEAVKLEGGGQVAETVREIVRAGIPVCGHLGLTPQTATSLGGYKVQGRTAETARSILEDALRIEAAGAFLIVLECVPDRVGKLVSEKLGIPTIGIGAGPWCDGQVLVINDLFGIRAGFSPKFVKRYASLGDEMRKAVSTYREEVAKGLFPAAEHCFTIPDEEFEKI